MTGKKSNAGATIKYIEGSRFAHDRKAIVRKVEQIEGAVAALTDEKLTLATEAFFVIIVNEDTERAVIVDIRPSYREAMREAEVCFSAMHEIGLPFKWGIRIDRSLLRAK